MAPKTLIFAGAPLSAGLDWEETDLINEFCEPIARFIGFEQDGGNCSFVPATAEITTLLDMPSWRSIPLERRHLTTGHSQLHGFDKSDGRAAFFTASKVDSFIEELSQQPYLSQASSVVSVGHVLSQFYETSYAKHEDILSSQIAPTLESISFYTNDSSSYGTSVGSFRGQDVPVAGHLTDLKDVPNATYLNSIEPQTMTVNLIIGIISVPTPRLIKTRRGAYVELIEVLAGDETKSGFGINFWLSSSPSNEGGMKSSLSGLRPQDVVLMRNVALGSFKGKVYGQSLRKEMTKVHLLYRNRIDKTDIGGCYIAADLTPESTHIQAQKTKRVREWVIKFVGSGPRPNINGKGCAQALIETLPPDTQ